ncbi:hypothetical protein RISK_002153 [Rhodopirellula islandica]|uniref:Uncharacterized protein n=1 Tax=Rhodopirellula islandica TaxID=595434 RepID=A0A0J1BG69_RHOIS|nr:hypothetical protein RISK_002153 [Rhodopirellula islandica]
MGCFSGHASGGSKPPFLGCLEPCHSRRCRLDSDGFQVSLCLVVHLGDLKLGTRDWWFVNWDISRLQSTFCLLFIPNFHF